MIGTVPVAEQPGGLTAVGSDVAVVSVRARRLQLFDAASLHLVASVPIQGGPSHVAAFGTELYVVDTGGTHVRVFDTVPRLHLVGSVSVPRSPLGVAVDADAGPPVGHLHGIEPAGGALARPAATTDRRPVAHRPSAGHRRGRPPDGHGLRGRRASGHAPDHPRPRQVTADYLTGHTAAAKSHTSGACP